MKKPKKILLSFVGTNDAGKLLGKNDGAILTALTNQKYDEVILLWTHTNTAEINYRKTAEYLRNEIKIRKLAKKITLSELLIKNVTDHNQIYTSLRNFTDSLPKENIIYTAAISSGTPAMQVCWILLAESGDFSETNKLNLIQVKDPKFGKSENIPVQIDTALPRIVRLKEEVAALKKDLIPEAVISYSRPGLKIGDAEISLSPVELAYYIYFAERAKSGLGDEKFSGTGTGMDFLKRIIELHEELYPALDSNRMDLEEFRKKGLDISLSTFRGNVSKLNKKIRKALNNETIAGQFEVTVSGSRGAKYYGIRADGEKIIFRD